MDSRYILQKFWWVSRILQLVGCQVTLSWSYRFILFFREFLRIFYAISLPVNFPKLCNVYFLTVSSHPRKLMLSVFQWLFISTWYYYQDWRKYIQYQDPKFLHNQNYQFIISIFLREKPENSYIIFQYHFYVQTRYTTTKTPKLKIVHFQQLKSAFWANKTFRIQQKHWNNKILKSSLRIYYICLQHWEKR